MPFALKASRLKPLLQTDARTIEINPLIPQTAQQQHGQRR